MKSLGIEVGIIKTALKIACALFAPNLVAQEAFSELIDEASDYYSTTQNTLRSQIDRVVLEETSDKRLESLQVPLKIRPYIVSETKRLLEEVSITIEKVALSKKDNNTLAGILLKQYEKDYITYPLEEAGYISRLLRSILPRLIECLENDSSFLFNGLLSLQATIDELRKEIELIKHQGILTLPNEYPTLLSDRPYDLTDKFAGREALINQIIEQLTNQTSITLSGIGGIGKTEIAKAIIKKIEKTPCKKHGIYKIAWVYYDNQNIYYSITKSFRETRGIADFDQAWDKAYSIIQTLRNSLLLVIDNVETLEDDNLLRIADLPCRLLITSRVESVSSIQTVTVDCLPMEECKELFLSHYKLQPAPQYTLEEIIELADRHTVTIELLAKIAQIEEFSLQEFYQKLVYLGFNMSNERASAKHERLQKEEILIKQLSLLFSVQKLGSEETSLLVPVSVIPSLPFSYQQAREWFDQKDRSILIKLSKSGWIRSNQKNNHTCYSMHSVIASAVRFQYKDTLYSRCRPFICSLTKLLQYKEDEHGAAKTDLIQFSWSVNDLLESDLHEETDADFLYYLARIYTDIGNYRQALRLLRHSVRIYRGQKRIKLLRLVHTYNSIGLVYNGLYYHKYALTQYKKAMLLMEKTTSTALDWIPIYTNIGTTYMAIEGTKCDGYAYMFLREALDLAKNQYGEDDSRTQNIKFNLANCISTRNPEEAKKLFQEVINAEESIYGINHWMVANKYQGYGNFLFDLGEFREAEVMLEKALDIFIVQLGENHPATVDIKNSLGLINQHIDLGKAQRYLQEYLNCVVDIYGENNPATAAAWNNLGLCFFNSGEISEARTCFQHAIDIETKLGDSSPDDMGTYYSNQAQCYHSLKLHDAALDYYFRALKEYNRNAELCAGNIATLYGRIADVYFYLGDKGNAHKYFQLAESRVKKLWGKTHVSIASIYNNYAMLLEEEKEYDIALDKLEAAKTLLENAYQGKSALIAIVEENILRIRKEKDEGNST